MEVRERKGLLSPSEVGMMAGRDSFSMNLQKLPVSAPVPAAPTSSVQNMRLAYSDDGGGGAIYKPVTTGSPTYQGDGSLAAGLVQHGGLGMSMSEPVKRKRGRPRKYGPDGSMALSLTPVSTAGGGYSSSAGVAMPTSSSGLKKARGRPPGSGKKQQMAALGNAGIGFMPHVITVKAGEDVASKIMSFSQQGPRAVCILSANGAISNVTLRQPATSGGTVTYEGRFEILSLSGSFLLSESGGQRSRTGGLSVSLAGPDGRVLGGGVAGLLIAAAPVQVVVGSFVADGRKSEGRLSDPSGKMSPMLPTATSSPPSRGTLSESSGGGPGSPLNQSTGACNNNSQQGMGGMPWK